MANRSPLVAEAFCAPDAHGAERIIVVVKGTWVRAQTGARSGSGPLAFAEEQVPVRSSAEYRGSPGASSLRYDTDLTFEKPGTDCVFLGHAYAPRRDTRSLLVRFTVGPVEKELAVFGPRRWSSTFGLASITRPGPFERVALTWENAFGGADDSPADPAHHAHLPSNPVGVGFRAARSRRPLDGAWLPSIENPEAVIRDPRAAPEPAGLAPTAPGWAPRASYAGTYDDAWRRTRAPLLPDDFDPRFFCCAPRGLTAPPLGGGEEVLVEHATPDGRWHFTLPAVRPSIRLAAGARTEQKRAALDTVVVEGDERRVQLVWRTSFGVHGRLHEVEGVQVFAELER